MSVINPGIPKHNARKVFFKYVTSEVAKIILVTRKLRWSSPILFNDPFDVPQELGLGFDAHALNKALDNRMADLVEQAQTKGNEITDPRVIALLKIAANADQVKRGIVAEEIRKNIGKPTDSQIQIIEELKMKWSEIVPSLRILCLSERNDIISMWNNYADQYRGVILEFSAIEELDSPFLVARPVVYQDEPPLVASPEEWVDCLFSGSLSCFINLFREYEYIKTKDWSNEKEWRIVSGTKPGEQGLFSDYNFHPEELTGIFFGPKCRKEDQLDFIKLLNHGFRPVVYESILDYQKARIRFRTIDKI